MAELVTHQFCVIGKAAVAGDPVLPPLSPPQKIRNIVGGGCTEGKAAACSQKSLHWFLLFFSTDCCFFFFNIHIYIIIYIYIYI